MKIYIADFGWAGSIVVIADTEEEARGYMVGCPNYHADCELEVQEIAKGCVSCNLGDL